MIQPPDFFEEIRVNAANRWKQWTEDPELGAPVRQLFEQVQNPNHVVSELLQNADDATATEASVTIKANEFVFAHNGEDFTREQFASLCRFAYSNKRTLSTTGFRGIGFKSTFSLGPEVRLFTPTLAVRFLTERFTEPVWMDSPANDTMKTEVRIAIASAPILKVLKQSLLKWERSPTSLLFCKNLRALRVMDTTLCWTRVNGPTIMGFERWSQTSQRSHPVLLLRSSKVSFPQNALDELTAKRQLTQQPKEGDFDCSVVIVVGVPGGIYSILPTEERTALPFACNAPFVQHPDRVGIVPPETSPTNRWLLERVGQLAAEGMLRWLKQTDLEISERCNAYRLMPAPTGSSSSSRDRCLKIVSEAFRKHLNVSCVLISEEGRLLPSGACVAMPNELLNLWSPQTVASLLAGDGKAILNRCVDAKYIETLANWRFVTVKNKRDVLELLAARKKLPRPQSLEALLSLWAYVSDDVTHSHAFRDYRGIPVLPVEGTDVLFSQQTVVRPAGDMWTLSLDDFSFLASRVSMLDRVWLQFLEQRLADAEQQRDEAACEKVEKAYSILRKLGLDRTTDVRRVIERVTRHLLTSGSASEWVSLAHIAAKLNIRPCSDFRFLTRDGQLRPVDHVVIADPTGSLRDLTEPNWYEQHVLHSNYTGTVGACITEEWNHWIKEGHGLVQLGLPLKKETDRPPTVRQLEDCLAERGFKWTAVSSVPKSFFTLEDWDFAQNHWDFWDRVATNDETIWFRLVTNVLAQTKLSSNDILYASVYEWAAGKKALREKQIPAKWICRLRKQRCLRDSQGRLRRPKELLRRTTSAECLSGSHHFLESSLATEEAWPFLQALGVKDEPPGPLDLLHGLRALTQQTDPNVGDIKRLYFRLNGMINGCTEEDLRAVRETFLSERLIFTQQNTWARSDEVALEDDGVHESALLVLQEARDLFLWRELNIALRPSMESTLAGLHCLPPFQSIGHEVFSRVKSILARYPMDAWETCKHWISIADEWVPVDGLVFQSSDQSNISYKLFPEFSRRIANFTFVPAETRATRPFTDLMLLEHAIEERPAEFPGLLQEPVPSDWLMALGRGFSRVLLPDSSETEIIRRIGTRLSKTRIQIMPQLRALPYIDGQLAGTSRSALVLWSGESLYLRHRSPGQMARIVAEELGRFFRQCEKVVEAIKYCYDRDVDFVRQYLEANFDLESPTTSTKSSRSREGSSPETDHSSTGQRKREVSGSSEGRSLPASVTSPRPEQQNSGHSGETHGSQSSPPSQEPAHRDTRARGVRPGGQEQVGWKSENGSSAGESGVHSTGYAVLRSYVAPRDSLRDRTHGVNAERREFVSQIGVMRVLEFERRAGRIPKEMPPLNPGYDVCSENVDGKVERYIEVKSLAGDWRGANVAFTRAQFKFGLQHGEKVWLYVVERAEQENFRIHLISNPARRVNRFMFDYGWKDLSESEDSVHLNNVGQNSEQTASRGGPVETTYELEDLLRTLPDAPFVKVMLINDDYVEACDARGLATFRFFKETDPLPEQNSVLIVRHSDLRPGGKTVPIAVGKLSWSRQQDSESENHYVVVVLRARGLPAKLVLPAVEWDSFRPLATLCEVEGI